VVFAFHNSRYCEELRLYDGTVYSCRQSEYRYKRALELSEKMTYGHKFNIFVLRLSFIGWYLLGVLACCIGVIFVPPYEHATMAELYLVLRQQAIERTCVPPKS